MNQKSNWVIKNHTIEGDWAFVEKDGSTYLEFADNFKTDPGPDVKVYLAKKDINDIDKHESVDLEGFFLGEMHEFTGKHQFKIKAGINLDDFISVVIHCKKYSVVWGGANIK